MLRACTNRFNIIFKPISGNKVALQYRLITNEEISVTLGSSRNGFQELYEYNNKKLEDPIEYMPIRAVHIARRMNIAQLFTRLYTDRYKVQHFVHKNSVVLRLRGDYTRCSDFTSEKDMCNDDSARDLRVISDARLKRKSKDKYVVYYDFGAAVFFNCDERLTKTLIEHAKRFCSDVFEFGNHDEELMLLADSKQTKWSELKDNSIRVQKIDQVNVEVIAGILAQTVALEHYERQVEGILGEFELLNSLMERRGAHGAVIGGHKKLFQIIATNNTLLIDLVSKLRVIDRKRPGDVAWDHKQYHEMWEAMLEDFELNERFSNLNFKLELIQQNTKFFLEVLGTHKGERLEWYIIFLISAELALSVYSMVAGVH